MPKHHKDLTTERVIEKAIATADRDGVGPLTMRSLAKSLGVTPMSLYRHVANKDDLLDKMVDVVFSEIELPLIGGDWRSEMRRRARSARIVLLAHRWALGLVDSRGQPGPATQAHHNAVIGTLREAGFTLEMTTLAFAMLDAYIYGFILQEISLPFDQVEDLGELGDEMAEAMDSEKFPYLTELAGAILTQPGFKFGELFEVGLDRLMDGLASVLLK